MRQERLGTWSRTRTHVCPENQATFVIYFYYKALFYFVERIRTEEIMPMIWLIQLTKNATTLYNNIPMCTFIFWTWHVIRKLLRCAFVISLQFKIWIVYPLLRYDSVIRISCCLVLKNFYESMCIPRTNIDHLTSSCVP